MLTAVVETINRFNAAHPWSHNDFYHRWLLRQLPERLGATLDVGCGTGTLVRAIASRADLAEGIDTDRTVLRIARETSVDSPNATFDLLNLLEMTGEGRYDAVTAIAVVHHLALDAALTRMRTLLAPGGTIVIVGCYRAGYRPDLIDIVAVPANMLMGAFRGAQGRQARVAMTAPTAPPHTTLAEVRAVAAVVLPGARIRRRLFWRYSLTYTAPRRS